MTKTFGEFTAILEPNEDRDGIDCWVSCGRAASSLAVLEDFGALDPDGPSERRVPRSLINKIRTWAEVNGY